MSRPSKKKGFTIAELIIVIAIFSVITTVALLDQNRLNSGILITNLGYEAALAVREAQVYGVGVRDSDGTNSFRGQYGAYFDMNSPTQIVVFGDNNGDTVYTPGEEKFLYSFTNQRGNKITALCVDGVSGKVSDDPCTAASPVEALRVIFTRPSQEAKFYTGVDDPVKFRGPAYIVVNNVDNNNCRVIVVEPTGQIRVERESDGSCQ